MSAAEVVVVAPAAIANGLATGLRAAGLTVRGSADDVAAAVELAGPGTVFVADIGNGAPADRPDPANGTEDADGSDEGAELVLALLDAAPGARVLAVAATVEHAPVLAAMRAGAAGFVVRTLAWTALAEAVERAAAGEVVFSPGLAELVLDGYGTGDEPVQTRLTEREADVIRLVVEGLTARQIAGRLVLSPRTVENHIQRTQRKLRLTGRAALVRYAIENGLA
jgi:DNA-binding NarL/FixJ family response regulator